MSQNPQIEAKALKAAHRVIFDRVSSGHEISPKDMEDAIRAYLREAAAPSEEPVARHEDGRRVGSSKLVYNKVTRTIDTVPVASPAVAPVASVKGLPLWQVGSWGDGSTPAGQANIFCEAYEVTIATGIDWVKADDIVTCHNEALSSIIPATKGGEVECDCVSMETCNCVDRTSYGKKVAALAQDTDATPPVAPTGTVGRAKEKLELWFFRDMSDEQRLALFSIFGMPVDEIGKVHGHQRRALNHILRALSAPTVEETKP